MQSLKASDLQYISCVYVHIDLPSRGWSKACGSNPYPGFGVWYQNEYNKASETSTNNCTQWFGVIRRSIQQKMAPEWLLRSSQLAENSQNSSLWIKPLAPAGLCIVSHHLEQLLWANGDYIPGLFRNSPFSHHIILTGGCTHTHTLIPLPVPVGMRWGGCHGRWPWMRSTLKRLGVCMLIGLLGARLSMNDNIPCWASGLVR